MNTRSFPLLALLPRLVAAGVWMCVRLRTELVPLLALLPILLLGGCGGDPGDPIQRIRDRGALVVAIEAEFAPFETVAPDGSYVGFDIDLAKAIADDLGVKLEFHNVKFAAIISELTSGRVDLIVSGMTITPERERSVLFSTPYFYTWTALLVNKAKSAEIRSVDDLNRPDRIVAVKEATTGVQAAKARCPKAKILSEDTENAAAMDVAEGRADAFLYDLSSLRNHHKQHPDTTVLLEAPVSPEPYAIALRLDEPTLKARVDKVLSAMRADGRLKALVEKHRPEGALEKP